MNLNWRWRARYDHNARSCQTRQTGRQTERRANYRRSKDFQRVVRPGVDPGFLVGGEWRGRRPRARRGRREAPKGPRGGSGERRRIPLFGIGVWGAPPEIFEI